MSTCCGICKSTISVMDSQSIIKCFGSCRLSFHASCVSLSAATVKQCNNSKNVKFVCDDCCNDNPMHSYIEQLKQLTATLTALTSTFQGCADVMMKSYASNNSIQETTATSYKSTVAPPSSDGNLTSLFQQQHQPVNRASRRSVLIGTGNVLDNMNTVEPRKWIFLSRFASTVDENRINQYIRDELKLEDVSCQRVLPKNATVHDRPYSSFKMNIPASEYARIMSADAWPKGVLVKDFVGRNLKQQDFLVTLR